MKQKSLADLRGLSIAISELVAIISLRGSTLVEGYILDGQGLMLGRDFLNFWHYGLAAWSPNPSLYFDNASYNVVLDSLFSELDYPNQHFSYPPHVMVFAAPFGLLGYNWALGVFTLFGIFAFWRFAVHPLEGRDARMMLWLSPMLVLALICGQFSLMVTALFALIFVNLDRRPLVAGALLAVLTIKPQLGLLFPVFLLFSGRWRVILWAGFFTVSLLALSVMMFGLEPWQVYLGHGVAYQSEMLSNLHPFTRGMMPTIFVNLRIAGVSTAVANIIQLGVLLMLAGLVVFACLRVKDPFLQYAVLVASSFIATPYMMMYDTLVFYWVLIAAAVHLGNDRWLTMTFRFLLFLWPLSVALSMMGIPGSALVMLFALVALCRAVFLHEGVNFRGRAPVPA